MNYKGLIVDEPNQPATLAQLALLESVLGRSLPEDYRSFLTSTNGCVLEYEVLVQFEGGTKEELSFSTLYGVCPDGSWATNPFELVEQRQMQSFPDLGVLPIGRDGGSSVLYLDLRSGYSVVAYVHGLPEWTGLRRDDALVTVAATFDDYLAQLHISDESAQDHISTFKPSTDSVRHTIEWLDSGSTDWRSKFRELWNDRVPVAPI